jgi:uncharacterized protein YbjT (DUF2867 family)
MHILIAGSTGLVGTEVLKNVLSTTTEKEVATLTALVRPGRKDLPKSWPPVAGRLRTREFDFLNPPVWREAAPDVVICALGTTRKAAGSAEAFFAVDYTMIVNLATWARNLGVPRFLLVSSVGANAKSWTHYLATKGKTENKILEMNFDQTAILRPSLLLGDRADKRLGEEITKAISSLFLNILWNGPGRRYQPVEASVVAACLVSLALMPASSWPASVAIFENNQIKDFRRI